tara:strand:- start:357 stop:1244 length:888 start_codon:yes stop_codon:yes gene_type:complete
MNLDFKRGSLYTRESIGEICYPGVGRPSGGNWDTGYVRVEDNLIIFMNIGVPGRTGHDFDNKFDEQTNTITWYGKNKSHSGQPLFKKLIEGSLTPHFFARWNQNNPRFTYLGIGSIIDFLDQVQTMHGNAIEFKLVVKDAKDIFSHAINSNEVIATQENEIIMPPSSFVLEKHLEDYLCKNWGNTVFGRDFNIYENGRQYQTNTGPMDILAQRKDEKEFLVLELKRDMASDAVVGQTLSYMGYVKEHLAINEEKVSGCIIATKADQRLRNALTSVDNIDFYEYKINFEMHKSRFD